VGATASTSLSDNWNIIYTYPANFTGHDTLEYQISCNSIAYSATVYISVVKCPDNIIDSDCYDDPPVINWDYQLLMTSPATDQVYVDAIPLVGDIDNDGKIEIIAPANATTSFMTQGLFIFEVDPATNSITKQQDLNLPWINRLNNVYAIGKVDGNDYAALFVATSITNNSLAADQGQLIKYIYNGSQYVESWRRTYTTSNIKQSPQPMIVDFNNDGIPEVLMYDKVFNARTGTLLADGGYLSDPTKGFGLGGHMASGAIGWTPATPFALTSMMAITDVDGDGVPEVIGGNCVYKVNITNTAGTAGNSFTLFKQANATGRPDVMDGATAVADMDGDYLPDVIVTTAPPTGNAALYICNPRTGEIMNVNPINNLPRYTDAVSYCGVSVPFIGDINADGMPEICLVALNTINAYDYDPISKQLSVKWTKPVVDPSGATTIVMFDFDQDGKNELVYRDQSNLRILNGENGTDKITSTIYAYSSTANEYPLVVDVNNDGAAEIVVLGKTPSSSSTGRVMVFSSKNVHDKWAPTRKVWNQFAYNAVNVNDDLTIPEIQLNPATLFPNGKQPYNGYLMQQTMLSSDGDPLFLLPDVYTTPAVVNSEVFGDSISITVGVINRGDAAIGPPIYVSAYRELTSGAYTAATPIRTDSLVTTILPGDTAFVIVRIPHIAPYLPLGNIVLRLNDKGGNSFPYQAECDSLDNTFTLVNPAMHLMMKKSATLLPLSFQHNGTYPNPVATLLGEEIEYRLSLVNAFTTQQSIVIRDTLPAYLYYVSGSTSIPLDNNPPPTVGSPPRYALEWTINNVSPTDSAVVTFLATQLPGVSASQPMFINNAWMTIHGFTGRTNNTYHQGAGLSIMTFSAGFGGSIYHAAEQMLDYGTSARSGVVIVPDEGYRFAGWSHAGYQSLRGETIGAKNGILHYDTLIIYGDVALRADFEPEIYSIVYHLHGGSIGNMTPSEYTINSETITLATPQKEGDEFIGWTGSNGDVPQLTVAIPQGSTGERTYYANFLLSGRQTIDVNPLKAEPVLTDKIWSAKNELYINTSKPGSIVRIHSMDGVLLKQQPILQAGKTTIKLTQGMYVVTLNNGLGTIVLIE
jgi:uncharacterized repeat protein (TIGR02543 family)